MSQLNPAHALPPFSLLRPWSRFLLQQLIVAQLAKKSHALYGTWNFVSVFAINRHWTQSWARWIQPILFPLAHEASFTACQLDSAETDVSSRRALSGSQSWFLYRSDGPGWETRLPSVCGSGAGNICLFYFHQSMFWCTTCKMPCHLSATHICVLQRQNLFNPIWFVAVAEVGCLPTLQSKILPPSSGMNSKTDKQPARRR
jgi:hypothetical protein